MAAKTMIVEPCWNQPSRHEAASWPLLNQRSSRVAGQFGSGRGSAGAAARPAKCSRMLATRIAATGTSAIGGRRSSRQRSTARSLRQNSRSTRASAIGLTFQVSPLR
jgi:hypothetical protein